MTRDMDLIRELLLKLEAIPKPLGAVLHLQGYEDEVAIPGYDAAQIDYHLALIREAGFIDDAGLVSMSGSIGFRRLSWHGHEFLDTVRDPEVWRRTKDGAKKVGGASVDFVWQLGKAYGKQVIKEKLGIDLA